MAYLPHQRIVFSGIFGTATLPYERWSMRLNFTLPAGGSAPSTADLTAAGTAWSTHMAPRTGTWCRLTEVKGAQIGVGGLYVGGPNIIGCDYVGSSGFASNPPQIALVASLVTAERGPRYKGRIYLPAPGAGVTMTLGTIDASNAQPFATSTAAFIAALNALPTVGSCAVASSYNLLTVVQSVRVGRVFDTMRSRRTSIPETYGAAVASP